jgi:superfamily II DNA helicase RecQ
VQRLKARSDRDGRLTLDNPRDESERIRLAIAERADALSVEPAPGGRLELTMSDSFSLAKARATCAAATDRSWRAYRAIEAFSFSRSCRRRRVLDHFGDDTPAAPEGRCCDVCAGDSWLPAPDELKIAAGGGRKRAAAAPADLSPEDEALFTSLVAWRRETAGEKPAYTVANNRTLETIAASRPADLEALAEIHGVGPAFIERHAHEVLELIAAQP